MNRLLLPLFFLIMLVQTAAFAQDYDDLSDQAVKERKDKNYQKAIELCNQSIYKQANARAFYIRGLTRYDLKEYESAIDDFNSAFSHYAAYYSTDKQKGHIYYYRARSKQHLKKYSAAIEDFNSAIYYNYDQSGYAYWNRAAAYYSLGKYQEASDDYTRAIEKISSGSDLSRLYNYKGESLAYLKKYEEAYTAFAKSISYNPDNYEAYWNRGYYEDINGKNEEALTDYNKAIEILKNKSGGAGSKDLAILYRNSALRLMDSEKYDEAKTAIDNALAADPNYSDAYQTRASINKAVKQYDKARKDYENAITLSSDDLSKADIYLSRSMMEWNLLEYKKCMDDLNKAVLLDSSYGMYYWHRSIVYGYMKNYPLAIKQANMALERYTNDSSSTASLWWHRGLLKDASGDYKGAVDDFKSYLKYYPGSYSGYYELARILKWRMKNDDLAAANLDKAATLAMQEKDTSKYYYIKIVKGEKETAISGALALLETAKGNEYAYKWELHNLACIYTLSGNTTKGFEYLDKSLAAGFDDYRHLVNDRDLLALMKLPQWKIILTKYKVPAPKM